MTKHRFAVCIFDGREWVPFHDWAHECAVKQLSKEHQQVIEEILSEALDRWRDWTDDERSRALLKGSGEVVEFRRK